MCKKYSIIVFACFFVQLRLFAASDWQGEYQPDENTIALWHFNDGEDKLARDAKGGRNNATLFNMDNKAWVPGQTNFGTALLFDGKDDYVSAPNSAELNLSSNLRLEAWVKPANVSRESVIVDKQGRYSLGINGSSEFQFGLKISGSSYQTIAGKTIVQPGQWYHVAGTYDGRTMRLFVNGTLEAGKECPGSIEIVHRPLTIGAATAESKDRSWFSGVIDEVRISSCPGRDLSGCVLSVPKASVPPKIDGMLDDPCWENAAMADNFVRMDGNAATKQTKARVTYDHDNLYVALECFQPAGEKLTAAVKERDGMVCEDDSIEIVIDPDNGKDAFYQLLVNSLGTVFDLYSSISGAVSEPKWNFEKLSLVAKTQSDRWIVETAIPVREIGKDGLKEGEVLGINFIRNDRGAKEFSAWVPVPSSGHHPAYFGQAIIGGFQEEIKARLAAFEEELNKKIVEPLKGMSPPPEGFNELSREAEGIGAEIKKLADEVAGQTAMTLAQWRDLSEKIKAQDFPAKIRRLSWLRTDYVVWYQEDEPISPEILPPLCAKSMKELKLTAFPGDYRKIDVLITNLKEESLKIAGELATDQKLAGKIKLLKAESEAGQNMTGNITLLLLTSGLAPGQYEGELKLQAGGKEEKIKLVVSIIPAVSLVASGSFAAPQRWLPKKIAGKDFWNMFRHNVFILAEKTRFEEDFINESVLRVGISRDYAVVLREMEVFPPEAGTNIALGAKQICGGGMERTRNSVGCGYIPPADYVKNLEAINDGNLKTAASSKHWYRLPISGWYGLEFGKKETLSKVILYHGFPNNNSEHFVLQYWDGNSWKDITGTETRGNMAEKTEHVFAPIATDKVRVMIFCENYLVMNYPAGEEWRWWFLQFGAKWDYEGKIEERPFLIDIYDADAPEEPLAYKAHKSLKEKYGDSFLGFGVGEWPGGKNLAKFIKGIKEAGMEVNRKNLCEKIGQEFKKLADNAGGDFYNMWAGFLLNRQGLEWGAPLAASETTQRATQAHHQTQMAFTRGAARQYDKPWYMYFAYDLADSNPSYDLVSLEKARAKISAGSKPSWLLGPNGGVSPYLYRRTLYAYYMSGANFVDHESQGDQLIATYPDGRRELSPHGKVVKEWFAFTQKHPNRGVPWTPIGLMLDYYDGFTPCMRKLFCALDYTDADHMTYDFIYNIFPCTTKITSEHNGVGLVNTPYGDIFDVLVPNPPSGTISQDLINNYKVQILLGDLRISRELAERLKTYVRDGGTLVLNVKQVGEYFGEDFLGLKLTARVKESPTARSLLDDFSFSSNSFVYQDAALASAKTLIASESNEPVVTLNKYGKGNVILTLVPYLMDKNKKQVAFVPYLLRRLSDSVLPMLVRGDIEYILNRTDTGWLITLLNNKGVYKEVNKVPVVKAGEKAQVFLLFKEAPKALVELTEGININWKKNDTAATLIVPAGGVAVVKVQQ